LQEEQLMRKTNDKSLKEAIEQMLNVYKIKRKFEETSIVAIWPELVGKSVANRTKELYISNKKLFLRIESSVIKNELMMMRSQIIGKINDKAKEILVEEIIFL
jgi:predicted nucleic acid-binding Zn ribbon protein